MNKREMVRSRIEEASRGINNAVCWDDPEWNDENGKSIMDRLVEDIDRIYGVREDDGELITEEWLYAVGGDVYDGDDAYINFLQEGDLDSDLRFGLLSLDRNNGDTMWAFDAFCLGEYVEEFMAYRIDDQMTIQLVETRGSFRRLCEALGIELKETV